LSKTGSGYYYIFTAKSRILYLYVVVSFVDQNSNNLHTMIMGF
jgi:hypothetical protein